MTAQAIPKPSLYEALCALLEGIRGEIVNGRLHTQPRPTGPMPWPAHVSEAISRALTAAGGEVRAAGGSSTSRRSTSSATVRSRSRTSPGGGKHACHGYPRGTDFEVVPDWVCEVLSPSTKRTDREEKMSVYASFGVNYAWLVDPETHTLEAYAAAQGSWRPLGIFRGDDRVRVAPFDTIAIHLADLWG